MAGYYVLQKSNSGTKNLLLKRVRKKRKIKIQHDALGFSEEGTSQGLFRHCQLLPADFPTALQVCRSSDPDCCLWAVGLGSARGTF